MHSARTTSRTRRSKNREGHDRLRAPDSVIEFLEWLADQHKPFELERWNRRGVSAGQALAYFLMGQGLIPTPEDYAEARRALESAEIIRKLREASLK